jgi:hypothetical protein
MLPISLLKRYHIFDLESFTGSDVSVLGCKCRPIGEPKFDFGRFGNLYRKNASNPTAGQENPLPYTPIESADIDKNTNRFTSATGTTYNDAGQVTSDNKFRLMSFGYDANGRMVKAAKANVPDALSVYDALGNRVATKVNDLWQFVIYDAFGKLIAEYGGLNSTDEGGGRRWEKKIPTKKRRWTIGTERITLLPFRSERKLAQGSRYGHPNIVVR